MKKELNSELLERWSSLINLSLQLITRHWVEKTSTLANLHIITLFYGIK